MRRFLPYLWPKGAPRPTVRGSVDNLLGTNESFSRTFFDGRRNATNSNISFTEDRDRFYGPIFTQTISGTI